MSPEQNDKRITILTAAEINELYSLPKFTRLEREDAFYLTEESEVVINSLRRLETKAYYIIAGLFPSKTNSIHLPFSASTRRPSLHHGEIFSGEKIPRGTRGSSGKSSKCHRYPHRPYNIWTLGHAYFFLSYFLVA